MKVMVIGAGGYIGGHLCRHLASHSAAVSAASSKDGTGIDPETGLLSSRFAVPPGVDVVFYLAASPIYGEAPQAAAHIFAVNVLSAIGAAEMARQAGARRFIYASTGSVYQPTFAPCLESSPLRRDDWYSLSKAHAEESLTLFRRWMEVVVVRLFGVYGPGQRARLVPRLVDLVRTGNVVRLHARDGEGEATGGLRISPCYVKDVIEILTQLAHGGRVGCLNVASPEVVSIREIAETIGRYVGKGPVFEIASTPREFDLIADISLLERELAPSFTPFALGLSRTVAEGEPHA